MDGETNVKPVVTPEQHLDALQTFLADTAQITAKQTFWLNIQRVRGRLTPEQFEETDSRISEEIKANVEAASEYIVTLGSKGIQLYIRNGDDSQPLHGLGFEAVTNQYSAGIQTQDGPQMIPIQDTGQIALSRQPETRTHNRSYL